MIGSQPFLLNILFVWQWVGGALGQNQTISPECQSSCGVVDIPYPFGVGEGCYKDKGFEIICNSTNSSSLTPYLGVSGFEVLSISLDDSQLSISVSSTRKYFNKTSGEVTGTDTSFNFSSSSFTVSNYSNRLYGIGCDIFARITDLESQKYLTGCVSLCPNGNDTASPSNECSGMGCCETTIPSGIKAFNQQVNSINASNSDGLGYAMVQELGGNITQNDTRLLLDWRIENETLCVSCKDENSLCVPNITVDAYNCYCQGGFTGNAYIPNGCQDINECNMSTTHMNKTQCVEEARCVNLQGYYRCDCPSGSNGDGTTTGVGCRPNHSSTRYILIGQKPISSTRPEEDKNLVMHFIALVKEKNVFQILETRVLNEGRKEDLLVAAKLAKRCLKLVGKKRPTMREVTVELERLRRVEEQQCTTQTQKDINYEDTKYWLYDSSSVSISMSGPESEHTELIGKGAT